MIISPEFPHVPVILVTGSRVFTDWQKMFRVLDAVTAGLPDKGVVMHGQCDPRVAHKTPLGVEWEVVEWKTAMENPRDNYVGADWFADKWAREAGWGRWGFPADWDKYGLGAGPIRNRKMIEKLPNLVLAFPIGDSRGTRGAANMAVMHHIQTFTFESEAE